jgi:type IV secretion system protein VirB1
MVVAVLTDAEFAALAARCAAGMELRSLAAIVRVESGFDPWRIGVNDETVTLSRQPQSHAEAAAAAALLIGRGKNIDLGLAQINSGNLGRLGLGVAEVFDPCTNLKAAAMIYGAAYDSLGRTLGKGTAAKGAALSLYNTGDPVAGYVNGYVGKVKADAVPFRPPMSAARTEETSDRHTGAGAGTEVPASSSANAVLVWGQTVQGWVVGANDQPAAVCSAGSVKEKSCGAE